MKEFELVAAGGSVYEHVGVADIQLPVWCMVFDVESLDLVFDMTPAADAVPVIDRAIARINSGDPAIRAAVHPQDRLGLRGKRQSLEAMRRTLVDFPDATISGVVEDEPS
ncbi:hypothetical protein ACFWU5_16140 [Nocardia sp. NPDC058640]|uniref:hypothetical protein n=1 Tax=Nocardia sp. NPDC058640 TaxID=3346571 RepID=UPI0036695D05